jgi:hypothetical protein
MKSLEEAVKGYRYFDIATPSEDIFNRIVKEVSAKKEDIQIDKVNKAFAEKADKQCGIVGKVYPDAKYWVNNVIGREKVLNALKNETGTYSVYAKIRLNDEFTKIVYYQEEGVLYFNA